MPGTAVCASRGGLQPDFHLQSGSLPVKCIVWQSDEQCFCEGGMAINDNDNSMASACLVLSSRTVSKGKPVPMLQGAVEE